MGKFSDELTKFGCFLLVSLLVVCFLFPFMYLGTYKLINNIDSSIYARYATNEKFEENIFFNATVEEKTGIIKQLESEINDLIEVSRIQEFAYVIIQNQNKVEDIVSNNADYQTYLISIGSSVDDLIDWSEKTAALDDKISMGCLYLTFLLISIVMVVLLGFRKTSRQFRLVNTLFLTHGIGKICSKRSYLTDDATGNYIVDKLPGWLIAGPDGFRHKNPRLCCKNFNFLCLGSI